MEEYKGLVLRGSKEVSVEQVGGGTPKACYINSAKIVLNNPEYKYVLGIYMYMGLIPIEHAWILDKTGNHIDPTISPEMDSSANSTYHSIFEIGFDDLMNYLIVDASPPDLHSWRRRKG